VRRIVLIVLALLLLSLFASRSVSAHSPRADADDGRSASQCGR